MAFSESEIQALIEQYREQTNWDSLFSTVQQTRRAIKTLAEGIVTQSDGYVSTNELTTLYRLCENSRIS